MSGKRARSWIQLAASLIQNANFRGFFTGSIYQGPLKTVCVPGLNCYSCPGALGSCPIGSLQSFLSSRPLRFPYYVAGLLLFFGALLGRVVCGFLCPFGFVQDLLYKIPFPRKLKTFRGDKALRYLKYILLAVFVVALTMLSAAPAFCKYICPAGTLEGGLPLALFGGDLEIGALFWWKFSLMAAILLLCLAIYRPFCRYICPLGAIYGLMNGAALCRMRLDEGKCVSCGRCAQVCPMALDPSVKPNSAECIRCGDCVRACPTAALRVGIRK